MIVEIQNEFYFPNWRLQIYTDTFFPCTQARLLKLIKIINENSSLNQWERENICKDLVKGIQEQIEDIENIKKNRNDYFLLESELRKFYRNKALLEKELAKYDKD